MFEAAQGAGGMAGAATRMRAQMSSSSRRCACVAARIASALRPCSASTSAFTYRNNTRCDEPEKDLGHVT